MPNVHRKAAHGLEIVVRVALRQDARAPAQARAAIRETLSTWRVGPVIDRVVLSASELVTNAIRYGRPPVGVTLRRREHDVRLDVHDEEASEPDLIDTTRVGVNAESGRGIEIVKALADEVGCEQIDDDGKIVYASFSLDADPDSIEGAPVAQQERSVGHPITQSTQPRSSEPV